jgi:hypothetical protein
LTNTESGGGGGEKAVDSEIGLWIDRGLLFITPATILTTATTKMTTKTAQTR